MALKQIMNMKMNMKIKNSRKKENINQEILLKNQKEEVHMFFLEWVNLSFNKIN